MTLEFEEHLQQEFNNLKLESIIELIKKLQPIIKSNMSQKKNLDQVNTILSIVKFFKEKKKISFKQWKYINGYINRNNPKPPVIYANFNTVSK